MSCTAKFYLDRKTPGLEIVVHASGANSTAGRSRHITLARYPNVIDPRKRLLK